jgi:hypothetical protein
MASAGAEEAKAVAVTALAGHPTRSRRPVMLWVPPRGVLPECWLHTRFVVSIYYGGVKAWIELSTGKTVELAYRSSADAALAANQFQLAMSVAPSDAASKAWPSPTSGDIVRRP